MVTFVCELSIQLHIYNDTLAIRPVRYNTSWKLYL